MKRKQVRRYYGEEAQRVTLKDCQAAHMTIARLKAGQIRLEDLIVDAPKVVYAKLVA